jgi:hypothetical protein
LLAGKLVFLELRASREGEGVLNVLALYVVN